MCTHLNVSEKACQLALIPVLGIPDQPEVNIELHIMPHPDRTKDRLCSLASALKAALTSLSNCKCAVRITTLDPETYIALK